MKKLLLFILLPFVLFSCSKSDENGIDLVDPFKNDKPHKVRIEFNSAYPENFTLTASISYSCKNESVDLIKTEKLSFPYEKEFEMPRDFISLNIVYVPLPNRDTYPNGSGGNILSTSINVFIDENLVVSGSNGTILFLKNVENKFEILHGTSFYTLDKGSSLGENKEFDKTPYNVRVEVSSETSGLNLSSLKTFSYTDKNHKINYKDEGLWLSVESFPYSTNFQMYRSFVQLTLWIYPKSESAQWSFTTKVFFNDILVCTSNSDALGCMIVIYNDSVNDKFLILNNEKETTIEKF